MKDLPRGHKLLGSRKVLYKANRIHGGIASMRRPATINAPAARRIWSLSFSTLRFIAFPPAADRLTSPILSARVCSHGSDNADDCSFLVPLSLHSHSQSLLRRATGIASRRRCMDRFRHGFGLWSPSVADARRQHVRGGLNARRIIVPARRQLLACRKG